MMKKVIYISIIMVMVNVVGQVQADWRHWRGPNYDGTTTEKNLPSRFDTQTQMKWSVKMPGPGASTPVVVGDRIFLTAFEQKTVTVLGLCLNRQTGKELWRTTLGAGSKRPISGRENYLASPSAVTDGKTLVFLTGNGDLSGYTFQGKRLWAMNFQKEYGFLTYNFGYGASPTIVDGLVYVNVLRRIYNQHDRSDPGEYDSYILAIDLKTGKQVFRHVRENKARDESKEAYTTPIPWGDKKTKSILILGGDCLTAHDPKTGKELWRVGEWNKMKMGHFRIVPSVLAVDDMFYVCAPQGYPVFAYRMENGKPKYVWKLKRVTSDVPTPLVYQGRLYVLNDKKRLISCHDPKTGKTIWEQRLPVKKYMRASPVASDGKLFLMSAEGDVLVLKAGDQYELLHHVKLGGYPAHATIAISHESIFVRNAERLYCFGK